MTEEGISSRSISGMPQEHIATQVATLTSLKPLNSKQAHSQVAVCNVQAANDVFLGLKIYYFVDKSPEVKSKNHHFLFQLLLHSLPWVLLEPNLTVIR